MSKDLSIEEQTAILRGIASTILAEPSFSVEDLSKLCNVFLDSTIISLDEWSYLNDIAYSTQDAEIDEAYEEWTRSIGIAEGKGYEDPNEFAMSA